MINNYIKNLHLKNEKFNYQLLIEMNKKLYKKIHISLCISIYGFQNL
jgi:hypothetical protein